MLKYVLDGTLGMYPLWIQQVSKHTAHWNFLPANAGGGKDIVGAARFPATLLELQRRRRDFLQHILDR